VNYYVSGRRRVVTLQGEYADLRLSSGWGGGGQHMFMVDAGQAEIALYTILHCQYCVVYSIRKGGSWGVVFCAIEIDVQ